ncbi:MAG TPA: ubiquinol-cytochrome C chaperone family protein [Hyphomicrobiaceae bacterium]|nr:ubiquinol-cytochrome C chaperone family protein [Hyphomicrobiaceae bacterium]
MLTRLKMWQDRRRQARSLYGSIVTQARSHTPYTRLGVPDSPEGRFEMIALHLVVVLDRLGRAGQQGQRLARALTETFAVDLDDNFREMSVGDLAVPRHVKRAVAALYERYGSYLAALAAPEDAPLTVAIQARLASVGAGEGLDASGICAYIRRAKHHLDLLPDAEVIAGRLAWPQIEAAEPEANCVRDDGGEHAR